ncbi:MAG: FG-GAP-like repeat-containing protein [Saprospiraceae bacterium]
MIRDAKNIDIDGDGRDEIIIMKDMSNLDIFKVENSKITKVTSHYNLENVKGYWSSMNIADIDGDGDKDILVCNKGLNNRFSQKNREIEIHINDFDGNGEIEQIYCYKENNKIYPWVLKDELVKQIPVLKKKILKYNIYAKSTMSELFDDKILKNSIVYKINEFRTGIFYLANGKYTFKPLPNEAQWTDQKASLIDDFNNDNLPDLIIGGNQFRSKPEIGINAASYGMFFINLGKGDFKYIENSTSGLCIEGEIREILPLKLEGKNYILFARNNNDFVLYKYNN